MDNCLFCKIVKGEIPSYKIYEDENVLAFLDIFPVKQGQTIVIPKVHSVSSFTTQEDDLLNVVMDASKDVAKKLENSLGAERTFVVIQGLGVDHFHVKLYPHLTSESENLSTTPPDEMATKEELENILGAIIH